MLAFTQLHIIEKPKGFSLATMSDDMEVLAYPDVIVDTANIQVFKPFFSNEFPVCHQMSYGIFPCNPFETIDQFDAFPGVGVAPLVHHRIDDRECHPIIYDAESENVNVRIAVLPVGPVHSKIVGTLNGY